GWVRQYTPSPDEAPPALVVLSLSHLPEKQALAERDRQLLALRGQALEATGPLCQLVLVVLPGQTQLGLVVHHLVVDAYSWRVLWADLTTLYNQYMGGGRLVLPAKTHSYRAWSAA
ncbi:condensation domain-containing protein, partial [Fibrella aquatilis]